MLRLARLARLVRVMRFKAFKDGVIRDGDGWKPLETLVETVLLVFMFFPVCQIVLHYVLTFLRL